MDIGTRLRSAREQRNRSLRQVAQISGLGKSTLSRWERGDGAPNHQELESVLDAIGVSEEARIAFRKESKSARSEEENQQKSRRRLFRAARVRSDLTLGDAAERIGVSKATLSRWESGDRWPGRTRLAQAAEALGATEDEVEAIRSEGPLVEAEACSFEVLRDRVVDLRKSIPMVTSANRDLEFIGLDANLARREGAEAKRLRLELRTAYVEWLAWWYRDAEAASIAGRLLPALRKDPSSAVWGRVVRACAGFSHELKKDAEAALDLLTEAAIQLKNAPSEGFVMRELAGLLTDLGETERARGVVERAREAGSGEESPEVHLYCCSMIEATTWSADGRHDRAMERLPDWRAADPYLRFASAVGRAKVFKMAGDRHTAVSELEGAFAEALDRGLDHFAEGLGRRLSQER